jgi:MFS family permease
LRQLGWRGAELIALTGLATLFVSLDSSTLVLALPAIARDFHATVPALSEMGSVLSLGALAGLPLGMMADKVGRKRLLMASVVGFSLANLGSAAAPDLRALTVLRLVAVCFETSAAGIATALVVEEVPPGLRALAVSALTIAAGAGTGLTTVLWPLLAPHWRPLYEVGGAGLVAVVILGWRLRESRTWAASRHDQLSLAVLLSGVWRRRLLLVLAITALTQLFYQPAGLFVVLFGNGLGLTPALISAVIVISGLLSIPAFPVGGRLSDRFGRRRLGAALSITAAIFAAVSFGGMIAAYWAGNVLWSIFASAAAPVTGAWYGELFPTRARATSEAASSVAGAVGGVIGLQVVGFLTPYAGLGHGLLLCAAAPMAAALLLLLLPETRGEPLPE